jgi:acyl-CoA synthetase (AMP-forming)/AMP-acid ligase II
VSRRSGSPSAAPTATPTLRSVDRVSAADVDLLVDRPRRPPARRSRRRELRASCDERVVVVPASGATVTLDELKAFCADRIAGYKTPRSMELVDALPLSAAAKVLERELRRPYWADQDRAVH